MILYFFFSNYTFFEENAGRSFYLINVTDNTQIREYISHILYRCMLYTQKKGQSCD